MRLDADGAPNPFKSEIFEGAVRAQGTLGHPLLLGFLCTLAIALLIGVRPFRSPAARFALIILLYAGVFATSSRSGIAIASLLLLFSARKLWVRVAIGLWSLSLILVLLTAADFWTSNMLSDFQSSASVSNRASSIGTFVPLLTNQNPIEIIFGNGLWSTRRLYKTGVLPYKGGFYAIDNQLVSTLACCGFIALICIVSGLLWSLLKANRDYRWAIAATLAMFATFEVLVWPSSLALTLAFAAMAVRGEADNSSAFGQSTVIKTG